MSRRRLFFGWRVVGAAFTDAVFAWGIGFYGPPVFLEVLHASRGWPIALVSAALTAHFLAGAVVVSRLATLHERLGLVAATRLGAGLTALGLLGWALAPEAWLLFLAAPLSGAGWALTGAAALNAMVSPWFVRRRPAALSLAFNGASMGGVIFAPLWVALIGWLGFPGAAASVAATALLVLWVLAGRYLGRDPAAMGLVPDGDAANGGAAEASRPAPAQAGRLAAPLAAPLLSPWRDRRFLALATAAALALFAQIGLVAHLFSLLVPALGKPGAGSTMAGVTGCAIFGRFLLGFLLPPGLDRRLAAAVNVGLQALGSVVLLLAADSVPLLLLGCALFGPGLGNVTSLPPLIAQAEFRPAEQARVVAWVTATGQAAYAFAPAAFGLLRDLQGPEWLFAAAALVQLAAAGSFMAGRLQAPDARGDASRAARRRPEAPGPS